MKVEIKTVEDFFKIEEFHLLDRALDEFKELVINMRNAKKQHKEGYLKAQNYPKHMFDHYPNMFTFKSDGKKRNN